MGFITKTEIKFRKWRILKFSIINLVDYSHSAFIKTDLAFNCLFETLNYYLNYNIKTKFKLI